MRLKLTIFAVVLAAMSLPSHGEDLLEAYQQGRANDPTLSQVDANRRAVGKEGVAQAWSVLLPQINATASLNQSSGGGSNGSNSLGGLGGLGDGNGANYLCNGIAAGTGMYDCAAIAAGNGTNGSSGHVRSRDISASVDQVIFNMADYANVRAAHSTSNAQDLLYTVAAQNLYVRIASAYFTVLTSIDALTFAKASEDSYKQAFDQADQQFKVGVVAITDVYTAKAAYENAKAATVTAENTLNNAKQALTQITGQPVGELKRLREDLPLDPPVPSDENAWVQNATNNNPLLLSDQQSLEAAQHSISAARAGHLPTIGASVTRGKTTQWYEHGSANYPGNGRFGTTIGITLTVPIFSGGYTQSRVRQSIDQRDFAQDQLEIDRRQTVYNTLNAYRSIIAGISEVQSGQAAVDAGQKALDATRAGFNVGTRTQTDVLLAIQNLTQSRSTYSQSRHQFVLDKLLLKQAAGTIDYPDMEDVNRLLQ